MKSGKKISRILQYLEQEDISLSNFERKASLGSSYLSKTRDRGKDVTDKVLEIIKTNAPEHYYKIFPEEKAPVNSTNEDVPAYKTHSAIGQVEMEKLKAENEILRHQLRLNEKMDQALGFMQQHSDGLTGLNLKIAEIAQDGSMRAAIQAQYQEYLVSKLDHNVDAEATVVELQRKAFERMTNIRIADTTVAQGNQHSRVT